MKVLYDIKEMLEDELKKTCKQEKFGPSDLDEMYKMVDIIKDIETIEAMKMSEMEGYSGANGYSYANASMMGYPEPWPYSYEGQNSSRDGGYSGARGGYSGARGRDSMGRFTSRDSSYDRGYSGHSKEQMLETLKMHMAEARDENERDSYRRAIEQLSR